MIPAIKKFFAQTLGIDRAISAVLLGRGWGVISGPITVLMVAHFLSGDEQGYFYTFASILALQIFFDLGLAFVIMQFASHEKAGLEWENGILEGESKAKQRLAFLFRWSVKWYAVVGVIAFIGLWTAGFWFFGTSNVQTAKSISWQTPWVLLLAGTLVSLVMTPIWGILEGCGRIAEMRWFGSLQGFVMALVLWALLALNCRLYAGAGSALVGPLMGVGWILVRYTKFFGNLWKTRCEPENRISWRKELWPMQWKISLSWASGYFIFQLINPILFRYHGAEVAGQFGMTQKIAQSIQGLAYAWVSTKAATFGSLIAAKKYPELMTLFNRSSVIVLILSALGSVAFLAGLWVLNYMEVPVAGRFLPMSESALVCLNVFLNCFVFSVATLARAQKKEPFLMLSLTVAVATVLVAWFIGVPFGALSLLAGICFITLGMAVPFSILILNDLRKKFI